jgi:hypothetical protein
MANETRVSIRKEGLRETNEFSGREKHEKIDQIKRKKRFK